jgi:hypothetical protein
MAAEDWTGRGAFLVFVEEADGCSCYSHRPEDDNMPPELAGEKLLLLPFAEAKRHATAVLTSPAEVDDYLHKWNPFGDRAEPNDSEYRKCSREIAAFLRTYLCATENTQGPTRIILDRETMDTSRAEWEIHEATFHVYWFAF